MKKIITLSILIVVILSGCGDGHRSLFSGESESWRVLYEAAAYDRTSEEVSATIKYIGEGTAPKEIDYTIKLSSGGSSGKDISLEKGSGTIARSSCSGCAITREDEEIKVEVMWNGKKENLVLKNEK